MENKKIEMPKQVSRAEFLSAVKEAGTQLTQEGIFSSVEFLGFEANNKKELMKND